MATANERTTETARHCAYCGHPVTDQTAAIERFGEPFCTESHADAFVAEVRAARTNAVARAETPATTCALAPAGQRTWKDYLKRGACWGAPLLLLVAIPLFWSGNAVAATGGSILSVLALIACPLGMYFMMRAMGNMGHGSEPRVKDGADSHDSHRR
jgi:hypothetical protein